jgi:hypothetical protein
MRTFFCSVALLAATTATASQLDVGYQTLQRMTGCYLIDYNYAETEALKSDYTRDSRVYDVNRTQSVKEWIYLEPVSATSARLQHILFATELDGKLRAGSMLKHQGEDWTYDAPFLYEFESPAHWSVRSLTDTRGLWTRRVTNLDDGLRYQCAAAWSETNVYPEWSCANYAPIPGRETRDMGRKDYQALARETRIVVYGSSWLERQNNTKVVHKDGVKSELAREVGKNWYVRLPDSECADAQTLAAKRQAFWTLLRETWDEVLTGDAPFVESALANRPPRFVAMQQIEEQFYQQNLDDAGIRSAAKQAILGVIAAYRQP